jgi:hypothetical protein
MFCQEKTNYNKDVYPLIKEKKYIEAIPLLEQFLSEKTNHVNANYWFAKIMQASGEKNSDPIQIEKAIKHYIIAFSEASELDMTLATAKRYPDVAGLDSKERLIYFKTLLEKRVSDLKIYHKDLIVKAEEQKREQLRNELLAKEQADNEAKKNLIIKEEQFVFNGLDELVKITGLKELKTVLKTSYSLDVFSENSMDSARGNLEYNIINQKKYINGKIEFTFGSLEMRIYASGKLQNGNGNIVIDISNEENHLTYGALKLIYKDYGFESLRFEKQGETEDTIYFYETKEISHFNLEKDFLQKNKGLSYIKKSELGVVVFPLTQFLEYKNTSDSEEYIYVPDFTFQTVKRLNGKYSLNDEFVSILEDKVPLNLASILKNKNSINKFYHIACEAYTYKSEIYPEKNNPIYTLKELKEINIFSPEIYASKSQETVTVAELATLNSLAKKYFDAIKNGNYEVYKSYCPKAEFMSLAKFTKANGELNSKSKPFNLVSSKKALKVSGEFVFKDDLIENYRKSGCDVNTCIVLFGISDRLSDDEGLLFSKENGTWKVLWGIIKFNDYEEAKAYRVLLKEKITPCDCVQKIIAGDQFNADKCQFFLRYQNKKEVINQFKTCFSTLNYCAFEKQSKLLEVNLFQDSELLKNCQQ